MRNVLLTRRRMKENERRAGFFVLRNRKIRASTLERIYLCIATIYYIVNLLINPTISSTLFTTLS